MSASTALDPIDPSRSALLVMDYQNGIISRVENGDELLAIARNLIRTFREHGGTVGYVRVAFADGDWDGVPESSHMAKRVRSYAGDGSPLHVDSEATQIPEEIAPQDGDIVVIKKRVGPFLTTDLQEQLHVRGIDTLVLAGISTSGVVLSTVRDAHDRDFRVIVLSDACADPNPEAHDFLIGTIFPHQVDVTTVRELHRLMH
jgi:nicotinamidase-related amidase